MLSGTVDMHTNSRYKASSIVKEAQSALSLCVCLTFQINKIFEGRHETWLVAILLGGPTECWEGGVIGRLTFHCLYFSFFSQKMLTCMSQDHRVKAVT